ncbi:protein BatD [Ferrimonas sediminicola]|uniref:Protein BatD n=1 Tax=Ferrimonas sediminicola TaxID=2569538 RepID=A0A4U1BF08_9GAMM|nr:BatD family protein [Ferrimonas sediminicola]TKB49824.1 protein BatD [Ferrimonas sediminicola]
MVIRIILLLAWAIAPLSWAYSSLTASVDTNPVRMGHAFVLNVVADDELASDALDTSALLSDFDLLRNNISRSTQIINFNARKETRWQLLLVPKRTGTLLIPALEAGGVSTQAITLSVVERDAQAPQASPVFLRATLSDDEVWLGQPVDYQVKLYLAAELQRGSLTEPSLEGAAIAQMGQDSNTTEVIDGHRYRVIERHYLITPQQVGEFQIQGSDFSGDILRAGRSNDLFSRSLSKPVQVMGQALPLRVKAPPASFTAPWLVANAVVLSEEWTPQQDQVRVGEPLTRIISLTAVGTSEAALPNLDIHYPEGLKSYPDKGERSDQVRNREVVARLQQSTALVASQAGTYTLPEVRIAWWNAKMNRQEWATLPARTLTVQPAENQPVIAPQSQVQRQDFPRQSEGNPWFYSTWLLAVALIGALLWGNRRGGAASPPETSSRPSVMSQPTANGFERAIANDDLNGALQTLPARLEGIRGPSPTLVQVRRLFPELAPELDRLMSQSFGPRPGTADLSVLAAQVSRIKQETEKEHRGLPTLNPR